MTNSEQDIQRDTFRYEYTPVTEENKQKVLSVKSLANQLEKAFDLIPAGREMSLARTKLEESVMWAVKALTAAKIILR